MRILVTGGSGFVAGSILRQIPSTYDVFSVSRKSQPKHLPKNIHWIEVDGSDIVQYERILMELSPECIIHTLAMADIDECERDRARAFFVNVTITEALLSSAERLGSRFIYCSTDTVFDGKKGMYTEEDVPVPLNVYAETKVAAEKKVLEAKIPCVVARLSLVMGFPVLGIGNSFFVRMEKRARLGELIPMPADEYRTPIDVITVGKCLIELITHSFTGILHLAGEEHISRYNMGILIAREMGWDESLICAEVIQNGVRAPRPKDASLSNAKAKRILNTPFLDVTGGIRQIKRYKEQWNGTL